MDNHLSFDPENLLDPKKGKKGVDDLVGKAGAGAARVGVAGAVVGSMMDFISASKADRAYLSDMVEEYRPEIAERMGLSREQVTGSHFAMAFAENPVLAQAKEATKTSTPTRVLAGVVSTAAGSLAALGAAVFARGSKVDSAANNAARIAGGLAGTLGAMFAGKVTRKAMRPGGAASKLGPTAHHYIMQIKDKQQQGIPTTPADIFKVQLAVNPEMAQAIHTAMGKAYHQLDETQQAQLLQSELPEVFEANTVMAERINKGARPQGLLFGEVEEVKGARHERGTPAPMPEIAPDQKPLRPGAQHSVEQVLAEREQADAQQPQPQPESPQAQPEPPQAVKDVAPPAATPQETPEAFEQELDGLMSNIKRQIAEREGKQAPSFAERIEQERAQPKARGMST